MLARQTRISHTLNANITIGSRTSSVHKLFSDRLSWNTVTVLAASRSNQRFSYSIRWNSERNRFLLQVQNWALSNSVFVSVQRSRCQRYPPSGSSANCRNPRRTRGNNRNPSFWPEVVTGETQNQYRKESYSIQVALAAVVVFGRIVLRVTGGQSRDLLFLSLWEVRGRGICLCNVFWFCSLTLATCCRKGSHW